MSATSRRGVAASELERIGSAKSRMAWSGGKERPKVSKDVDQFDVNKDRASKGCWATFSGCVGGMWATRQMSHKEDREIYVRTTLRELIVYIIFLFILCVITFGMTSSTMFYYTKVLNELFMDTPYTDTRNTFRGSTQVMDFWRFLEMVLVENLYWEYWYDPQETATDAEDRNILYENRMIGVPRMRQLRVRSDSCSIPTDFHRVITKCYASYDDSFEDTEPFGLKNGTAWTYYTEEELGGRSYWGKLTTYSSAGSYVDLATTKNETKAIIADLRENLWITRGTRAVFIDFTVYNANINLFCVIKLVIEFPATGGIIPSGSFNTVRLLRYVTTFDYFVLACECIFTFFIIYYIIEECLEIASIKCAYFKSVWNVLDLLVIGLALVCIGFNVFKTFYVEEELPILLKYPNRFADFDLLGFLQSQFNNIVAVCVFFAWLKFFKYISFNKTMTQLSSTLSRCAKDVVGFAVMFFIVFFAFAQLGYLLFGTQVRDFSTFISASFNLLRTILGDFNFHEIQEANRVLGPIFFLVYVFFVFFVLLNMFLAIINDTYSEVKAEIASQRNEFEIADYFKRGYNNLMGKFGRRDKLIDMEDALKISDMNNDGMLSFEEVRTNLKKCNFSDAEIEMFFAKYDLDGNRMLEAHEVKRMLADLEGKRNEIENQAKKMQTPPPPSQRPITARSHRPLTTGSVHRADPEEVEKLNVRMNHMEHTIGSIVNKIDQVLVKFDSMDKAKSKRKETMSKMLDDIIEDKDLDETERSRRIEKLVQDELKDWEKSHPQRNKTAMKDHIKDCL